MTSLFHRNHFYMLTKLLLLPMPTAVMKVPSLWSRFGAVIASRGMARLGVVEIIICLLLYSASLVSYLTTLVTYII